MFMAIFDNFKVVFEHTETLVLFLNWRLIYLFTRGYIVKMYL